MNKKVRKQHLYKLLFLLVSSIGITNMTSRGGDVQCNYCNKQGGVTLKNKTALFVQRTVLVTLLQPLPLCQAEQTIKFREVFWTGESQ